MSGTQQHISRKAIRIYIQFCHGIPSYERHHLISQAHKKALDRDSRELFDLYIFRIFILIN